jgi:uncharacterized protein (DUF1697 family)
MNLNLKAKPQLPQAPQSASKPERGTPENGIVEQIIKDKAGANGGDDRKTESTPPTINVTVDTDPIAKLLEAQAASATEQFTKLEQQFKETEQRLNDKVAELAGAPRKVDDPGDLNPDAPKQQSTYIVATGRDMDPKAAFRIFEELFEKAQTTTFNGGREIGELTARDTRLLDRFVAANRPALQQAMQEHGYKHGLFRAAATTLTDIPASFSGYLSSIMRQTPNWGKVWHQFLNPQMALGTAVGNRVDVARLGRINRPTTSAAWNLTGNFATTSQNITNGYEKLEVVMYGMGENGANNDPVAINEYLRKHSILDLEAQIQNELGENYNEFREIITYEQYAGTNVEAYYKASTKQIVTAATSMTSADSGAIDVDGLIRLRAYMSGELGVIPWADGCYVLVCHPSAIVDLEIELKDSAKGSATYMEVEAMTNLIKMVNTALTSQISGYRFTVGGFHIFCHENLPPDPNFMKSSTGAAATLRNWYDNIAFGPMAVAEVISMPAEVRRDEMRQFGTQDRYIWLGYGKYQAIERGTASTGAGLGQRSQIVKFRSGRT